jgi:hypothetical protein
MRAIVQLLGQRLSIPGYYPVLFAFGTVVVEATDDSTKVIPFHFYLSYFIFITNE